MAVVRRLERTFVGRCAASFVELAGIDRAMVIASQAFTALIPLFILTSALAPTGDEDTVAEALIRRFDLTGDAATAVRTLFAHSTDSTTGVLSVVLLVFSGLSLARRMQRMYLDAWRLDPLHGVRGSLNAALGLAALLLEILLLSLARTVVRGLPFDSLFGPVLSAVAGMLLWTSIPWLLLDRRVAWQRLLPAGLLTSVCASAYGVVSTVSMPRLMESYSERYGLFGVTLALVGWLLTVSLIIVASTVVAAELDRAEEPWARRVRSRFGIEDGGGRPASAAAAGGEPGDRLGLPPQG